MTASCLHVALALPGRRGADEGSKWRASPVLPVARASSWAAAAAPSPSSLTFTFHPTRPRSSHVYSPSSHELPVCTPRFVFAPPGLDAESRLPEMVAAAPPDPSG